MSEKRGTGPTAAQRDYGRVLWEHWCRRPVTDEAWASFAHARPWMAAANAVRDAVLADVSALGARRDWVDPDDLRTILRAANRYIGHMSDNKWFYGSAEYDRLHEAVQRVHFALAAPDRPAGTEPEEEATK